jgi:hypothetical protein
MLMVWSWFIKFCFEIWAVAIKLSKLEKPAPT